MNKQKYLVCFALILAVIYAIFFSDWTKKEVIRIQCGILRFNPQRAMPGAPLFLLDHPFNLKSIKVVSVAEAETNKYPRALWYVASKKPVSVATFFYGEEIGGMQPVIPESKPEPLTAGAKYRLIIETSGHGKGSVDFEPVPIKPAPMK
jgi:hypothetical protein